MDYMDEKKSHVYSGPDQYEITQLCEHWTFFSKQNVPSRKSKFYYGHCYINITIPILFFMRQSL